jgi:putative hydrolase of the HAD superfamily
MAQLVRGQIPPSDFWNRVREITGIKVSDEELTARWVKDYEIDKDVLEAVKNAKLQGYKTCVCTNNNAIRLPILVEQYKLGDLFDVIVSSHQIGFTKPDRKIFEELLTRLDVKGEELVYSDDNPERLQGAKELGINTFQYYNFEQFLLGVKKLGVSLCNTENLHK